jgi:general nucleoside transport system permease protein
MVTAIAAVVATLLIGLVVVIATGTSFGVVGRAFVAGAIGSGYAVAASVGRSVDYALIGLGFVFAARAKLTNVGGEGQIAMGGIAATATALYGHVQALPFGLAFILPMVAAVAAGALWGGLAGALKAKTGTNEVISSLLLSFIGVWLVYWSVHSVALLQQPMTESATLPESLEIPDSTKLPLLFGDAATPLNIGLPILFAASLLVWLLLTKTYLGWRLRAVGLNQLAARRSGIPYGSTVIIAMAVAGAFGGLAGAMMLQGDRYDLSSGFSSGYGFDGLVVGLLARGSVSGVLAGAVLFGLLRSGGINMELVAHFPSAIVVMMQGIIVVMLAATSILAERSREIR